MSPPWDDVASAAAVDFDDDVELYADLHIGPCGKVGHFACPCSPDICLECMPTAIPRGGRPVSDHDHQAVVATAAGDLAERTRKINLRDGTALAGLFLWMIDNDFSWVIDLYRAATGVG